MIIVDKIIKNAKKAEFSLQAKNNKSRVISLVVIALVLITLLPLLNTGSVAGARPESDKNSNDTDKLTLEVVEIDSEINSLNERIAGLKSKSQSIRGEIAAAEVEIRSNRAELVKKKDKLNSRARAIYMNGRSDTLITLMTSDDFSDFMTKQEYIERLAVNDSKLVKETKLKALQLEDLVAGLKQKEKESDSLLNDLESRRDDLAKTKKEREAKLTAAGPKQAEVKQQSSRAASKIEEINPVDSTPPPAGKEIEMNATAYSPEEPGLSDSTATGLKAQKGVVAVDPSFIPLGTRLYVDGYGYAIAADTGSAIKGNRIDLCYNTLEEALSFGRRKVKVKILD